jgi:hypothetical protein
MTLLFDIRFREFLKSCRSDVFSETQRTRRRERPGLLDPGSLAYGFLSALVDLFLYHRFGWPSRDYRVCVSGHNLPGAVFRSKDHRDPQSVWGDILPSANLDPCQTGS